MPGLTTDYVAPVAAEPRFRAQLVELGRILGERRGYLALYPDPPKEFATSEELARVMDLDEVGTFADGTLYRVEGLRPGVG